MNDLARKPEELLSVLADMPPVVRELPKPREMRWLLERLRDGQPIRIDCGAAQGVLVDDVPWGADAFFVGGHMDTFKNRVIGCDDPTMFQSIHSFGETGGTYRVPLPNGRYRVTLFFCEGWYEEREYDVRIDGKTVLPNFTPLAAGHSVAHSKEFDVELHDGLMNIDFLTREHYADINGIRIERRKETELPTKPLRQSPGM